MKRKKKTTLSKQQSVIAVHLLRGLTIPQTAKLMGKGLNNIVTQVARMHKKLEVHNRAQLLRVLSRMEEQGLLPSIAEISPKIKKQAQSTHFYNTNSDSLNSNSHYMY